MGRLVFGKKRIKKKRKAVSKKRKRASKNQFTSKRSSGKSKRRKIKKKESDQAPQMSTERNRQWISLAKRKKL